jgi:acyl carrier protein
MEKEQFFRKLKEELDLEEQNLNEGSPLNLTSLMHLSLISFLDEHFSIRIKAADLKYIDSMDKLMKLIGKDKFIY